MLIEGIELDERPYRPRARGTAATRRSRRPQVWTVLLAAILLGAVTFGGYQAIRSLRQPQGPELATESPIPSRGASGCWPDIREVPCGPGAIAGLWYPYRVSTHCGLEQAFFDGRWWVTASRAGGLNAPPGWTDPSQLGRMRLLGASEAQFMAPGGLEATFIPADPGFEPPVCF